MLSFSLLSVLGIHCVIYVQIRSLRQVWKILAVISSDIFFALFALLRPQTSHVESVLQVHWRSDSLQRSFLSVFKLTVYNCSAFQSTNLQFRSAVNSCAVFFPLHMRFSFLEVQLRDF